MQEPRTTGGAVNFDLDRYYSYQTDRPGHPPLRHLLREELFLFPGIPVTGLWSVHPWDLDLTWADNMYDAGCGGTDEFKNRVLSGPLSRSSSRIGSGKSGICFLTRIRLGN